MQGTALTEGRLAAKGAAMTRTPLLLAIAAAAALAGCGNDNNDHTIVAGGPSEDPNAPSEVDIANVQLPPSITATKTYRCRDNSVLRVDWLSDGTARVDSGEGAGQPVQVGEGAPLQGSADASTVTYQGKTCKG